MCAAPSSGMITSMVTETTTTKPPLARRIAKVVLAIVLVLMAPTVIAFVVVGPGAAAATLMSIVAAVSGSMRSGWRRAAWVVPLLGVYAFATSVVGYGWGWVVVMGLVGLTAGIGLAYGFLPALLYAGMVPTLVTTVVSTREALFTALFAVLGGILGVITGQRMGMKPEVPGKQNWTGHEALSGALCAGLFVAGTSIAVATGLPHGYWVALTLIVVIPPIVQGDDTRRGRERLIGTVAGLAIVLPISLIPLPQWAVYLIGFALLVPAFAVMKKNYTWYAFFESAAIVMLVSAGSDMVNLDAARIEASVIGVALVAVAVIAVAWGVRHVSATDVPKAAIAP